MVVVYGYLHLSTICYKTMGQREAARIRRWLTGLLTKRRFRDEYQKQARGHEDDSNSSGK